MGGLSKEDWKGLLERHDVVVNCAGALQDGPGDNLSATQERAMIVLYGVAAAMEGKLIVQVSARTNGAAADTKFLSTKRYADAALSSSGLPYVILRPAVVVGRNAHGGTALIRALAAMPIITPLVYADSVVRTVALNDVAESVVAAIEGRIAPGSDIDLAAPEVMTLEEIVAMHRSWLGLPPARVIRLPSAIADIVSWFADNAGRLGWRSPLRSTATKVMSEGVHVGGGDKVPTVGGAAKALGAAPAGVQDLWSSRLYLAKPLVIVTLALFWTASGLVPLADLEQASSHFLPFMATASAMALTLFTCAVDVLLGLTVLHRRLAKASLVGMVVTSLAYLTGACILEPVLWLDPLGSLVKVLPSIMLSLVALAILEER
jgi:uncharacterized protein YbjT (DUF2867 family)